METPQPPPPHRVRRQRPNVSMGAAQSRVGDSEAQVEYGRVLDSGSGKKGGGRVRPGLGAGGRALAPEISGLRGAQSNTCGCWICPLLSTSPPLPLTEMPPVLIPGLSAHSCSPPSSEPPEPHDLQAWLGPEAPQLRRQSREGTRGGLRLCDSQGNSSVKRVCAGPWGHSGWAVRWRPQGVGVQRVPSGGLGRRGLS